MRLPSQRDLEQLRALQSAMRDVVYDRNTALRIFIASRNSTTPQSRREFWLEFTWFDQEYRVAVRRLARFCAELCNGASDPRDPQ